MEATIDTTWDSNADASPMADILAAKAMILNPKMQKPPELWIFPPLVRKSMPMSQAMNDPRYLSFLGEFHPDQTTTERYHADRVRRKSRWLEFRVSHSFKNPRLRRRAQRQFNLAWRHRRDSAARPPTP